MRFSSFLIVLVVQLVLLSVVADPIHPSALGTRITKGEGAAPNPGKGEGKGGKPGKGKGKGKSEGKGGKPGKGKGKGKGSSAPYVLVGADAEFAAVYAPDNPDNQLAIMTGSKR